MSNLDLFSQIDSRLILPSDPKGTVQLDISESTNPVGIENFGSEYLAVFLNNEVEKNNSIAVQGKYAVKGNYLVFVPFFPFEKGITYVVKAKHINSEKGYILQPFQVGKKRPVDEAKILNIYPSGNQLPENLLRFYIYFNTPMKKGQALKYIHLIDAEGNVDDNAFMEFKQELWSPDGKRLTVLFDPGRIKRGVSTNMELGPALLQGKRYQLSIDKEWEDVYGQSLVMNTTKHIQVVNAYRQQIIIDDWQIDIPTINTNQGLMLKFDRIMDHALLQSMIQLKDDEKNIVVGHWEILEQEQLIQFIPEKKWEKGKYHIVLDNRLEDLAGNNLNNLLDQIEQKEEKKNNNIYSIINFKI